MLLSAEDIKFTVPWQYPTPPQFTVHSPTVDQPNNMLDITILLPRGVTPRAMFEVTSGILTITLRTATPLFPVAGRPSVGKYQETAKYTIEVPTQWLYWEPEHDEHSNGGTSYNGDHVDHNTSTTVTAATTDVDIVRGQFSPWKVQHEKLTEYHKSIVGNGFNSFFRVVFFGQTVDIAEIFGKTLVLTSNDNDQSQEGSLPSPTSPISPLLLDDLPTLERM